jgi:sortase A
MKLVVTYKSLRWILRWAQYAFFAFGVAMLGYCGFVLGDGWMFQNRERRHFEQLLQDRSSQQTATGGLIGRIEIPRLGVSAMVMEGTSDTTLRRAVGHIEGTALPGQPGNAGFSGHRDTFFRPLRNIQKNDIITLTTLLAEFRYRVVSTRIVSPSDVAVLAPSGDEVLTLVTCYPFYFIGPAPNRFIVRAQRVI